MVKRGLLVALLFAALVVAAGVVMAQEMNKEAAPAATEATPAAAPAVTAPENVGNKVCPVSGMTIPELGKYTVEYQGKVYNLCSADCKAEFLKDPAKYIAKVDEEMAKEKAAAAPAAPAAAAMNMTEGMTK